MSATRYRRVLVGWDSSPGAAAALLAAAGIADGETGRVVALAVLRPVPRGESGEEERGAEMARHLSVPKTCGTWADALRDAVGAVA